MMRSTWAQPTAERRTRNRPEITATEAPAVLQTAMAARTCSGLSVDTRRAARPSAHRALAFDRAEIHVAGRQSWCAAEPTLEQFADGQERRGPPDGAPLGPLGGELLAAKLGLLGAAVEGEGALHRAPRHRIDPDGDADLPAARAALAHGAGPPRHARKSRDECRDRARIPGPRQRARIVSSTLDLRGARSEGFEPPTF